MSLINQDFNWSKSFQWKLVLVNGLVIGIVIWLAGVTVKDFACYLVGKYDFVGAAKNDSFNHVMQLYLLQVSILAVIVASCIHYLLIKKLLIPLQKLTESVHQTTKGHDSQLLPILSTDEIGKLTSDFNHLVMTLKQTEHSKKRLLGDMAHELRTPLTSLRGYTEALSLGIIQGDQSVYEMLHQESLQLAKLVEQLHQLTVGEVEPKADLAYEQIDVQEFVETRIKKVESELQLKQIMVDFSLQSGVIWIDQKRMEQVFLHLIRNAIQFDRGRKLTVSGHMTNEHYVITVTNIGKTIPQKMQLYVFEPFYRLDLSRQRQTGGGAGLGLAIAKKIVEQHGGEIGLHSEGNKHSFWFTIPKKIIDW